MKKHELLVPVGDMDCLYQAVHNGCDALYLGCKMFGARKFAKNFTNDEIISVIRYCHLYGVRVYVTMNTLVKNQEVDDFIAQARFLHQNGVDALIVQDFGMICLLREMFPNLEIHASTQANISSREVCELYHNLGVKRVVFARELTIEEIDSIDVDIEKEAFIHGALCISYSGCCLMSSMLGGRSGNRGECAGVCRMPFTLKKDDKVIEKEKYLLSTKELNTSSLMNQLLNSSIYSFKIEGRMKSPFYVGFITRLYRRLIDGEDVNLEEEEKKLKTIFNREFTVGRMFHANDVDFMNTKSPNHIGLGIGKVIGVTRDKIKIKLASPLHQVDAIRFSPSNKGFIVNYLYDDSGKLISSASSICIVDNKVGLTDCDDVLKTQDFLLEKEYEDISYKKIPVTFHVVAKKGLPLQIEITDSNDSFSVEGMIVEASINSPTSKEAICKQLKKLGNTPFVCSDISCEMDDSIFIPVKSLNEMRRTLVEQLILLRQKVKTTFVEHEVSFDKYDSSLEMGKIHASVYNEDQLKTCLSLGVDRVYVPRILYQKYSDNPSVYLQMDRCSFQITNLLEQRNLISDYLSSVFSTVIGNYPMNIFNIYTAYYLRQLGYQELCLSVELNEFEIKEFHQLFEEKFGKFSFEQYCYGRVENMIIKGNILNLDSYNYHYSLVDSRGRVFPVYYDGRLLHILHCECQNCDGYFGNIRLDFYQESSFEIKKVVKKYQVIKRNY